MIGAAAGTRILAAVEIALNPGPVLGYHWAVEFGSPSNERRSIR